MPPILKAALWMLGTLTSLACMAIAGRELSAELSTLQILFFRSIVGLAVILVVIWRAGWHHLRTQRPGLQILRNIAHYTNLLDAGTGQNPKRRAGGCTVV